MHSTSLAPAESPRGGPFFASRGRANGLMGPVLAWSLPLALAAAALGQKPAASDDESRAIRFEMAGMDRVQVQKDLVYRAGADPSLSLHFDLYKPSDVKPDSRLPIVLFVNGVGYRELKEWAVYQSWARATAASGLAAVTFETTSTSVETDIDQLVAHLRENAAKYAIDGENMCWWSCSANVARALPLALQEQRKYVRCAVVYYGMPQSWPKIRADLPLFIVKAGLDHPELNQRIDQFVAQATQQNNDVTYVVYASGRHAFDVFDDTLRTRDIVRETLQFMRIQLSPAVQKEIAEAAQQRVASAAFMAKDWPAMEKAYQALVNAQPDNGEAHFRLGLAQHYLGKFDPAIASFARAIDKGYMVPASTYNIACAKSLRGDLDGALAALRLALERGFADHALLKEDPDLANLRNDARFGELMKEWTQKHEKSDKVAQPARPPG
jgi:dienelactone hydrolase